jgi:hypothetical protein
MPVTPAAGPSCAGLPPQTPESSLPGLQGPPRRLGVSKPSWVVRTEVSWTFSLCPFFLFPFPQFVEQLIGGKDMVKPLVTVVTIIVTGYLLGQGICRLLIWLIHVLGSVSLRRGSEERMEIAGIQNEIHRTEN